jgi:hypothetical protein
VNKSGSGRADGASWIWSANMASPQRLPVSNGILMPKRPRNAEAFSRDPKAETACE